jgi:secretion/DNA translocation related TadE-like protein
VLVLVLVAVFATLAVGGAAVGGLVVGQRRAASAADLSALAAGRTLADGGGSASAGATACAAAARVSERNAARLTGCLIDGLEVVVEVAVEGTTVLGRSWSVPGRARAGPGGLPPAVTGEGTGVRGPLSGAAGGPGRAPATDEGGPGP